jgi:hypothetical protein
MVEAEPGIAEAIGTSSMKYYECPIVLRAERGRKA